MLQNYMEKFPGGSEVKASASNVGDPGSSPWVGKIPWRRKWQSTPVFLPGESHGRRSLVRYSPRGGKESDTTEWLHLTSLQVTMDFEKKSKTKHNKKTTTPLTITTKCEKKSLSNVSVNTQQGGFVTKHSPVYGLFFGQRTPMSLMSSACLLFVENL